MLSASASPQTAGSRGGDEKEEEEEEEEEGNTSQNTETRKRSTTVLCLFRSVSLSRPPSLKQTGKHQSDTDPQK